MTQVYFSSNLFKPGSRECASEKLVLRLFVAGFSIRSQAAIDALKQILAERFESNYDLEIVDIYQQPEAARQQQIIATPTLVRYCPLPKKVFIGDFSKTNRLIACLTPGAWSSVQDQL